MVRPLEVLLLQWGRRFSPTDTRITRPRHPAPPRFNGAVGFRLRIQERGAVRTAAQHRFNGAVGFRLRIRVSASVNGWRVYVLQWGRRFSPTDTGEGKVRVGSDDHGLQWGRRFSPTDTGGGAMRLLPRQASFNGAVGFRLRILGALIAGVLHLGTLQWGRRFSPTDTSLDAVEALFGELELQWGRRFSPTDTRGRGRHPFAPGPVLQWGRRFSPTDTCARPKSAPRRFRLQWGRRFSPTDTFQRGGYWRSRIGASMGP